MLIGTKNVGEGFPCFLIAEAGVNHNGSIDLAKKLVDAAVCVGVDAVKFQTFKAEDFVTKNAEMAQYQIQNIGVNETQYQMLKRLELSEDDFRELKKYCDKKGIIFLSTPHSSFRDVDFLNRLGVPAFKIASSDLTNLPFIEYVATKDKPIILSTGMGTLEEIRDAVTVIRNHLNKFVLLHCITNYPCSPEEVNLKSMLTICDKLAVEVGYSDHTRGVNAAILAVSLGACVIEKHLTLDRNMIGPDHKASTEPEEFKLLVKTARLKETEPLKFQRIVESIPNREILLGSGEKIPTSSEREISPIARKSLIAAHDLKASRKLTEKDIVIKRPGTGISPAKYWTYVGKVLKRNVKAGHIFEESDFG